MKKILIFFILFCFFSYLLYSNEHVEIINKIFIYGNIKTRAEIINRVLDLKPGDKFYERKIEKRIEKLKELGLFNKVEVETRRSKEGVNIFIILDEKSPLFFDFITVYSHEIYNNFWGAKIGLVNLFGLNQKFELTGTLGNLKKLELAYHNNYFIDFYFGFKGIFQIYKNKFYGFKEKRVIGSIFLGKRFQKLNSSLWLNYENIKIYNYSLFSVPDNLLKFGLSINFDTKDWSFFPKQGIFSELNFYKAYNSKLKPIYERYKFKISSFFNLWKEHVQAFNLEVTISKGEVPVYERLFFGGMNTLRAIKVWTYSGTNSFIFTYEYRIPLSLSRAYREESPTGTALYFFFDCGSIKSDRELFKFKEIKTDFGIGAFWVLMKEAKLRIDLSIQPHLRLIISSEWKF